MCTQRKGKFGIELIITHTHRTVFITKLAFSQTLFAPSSILIFNTFITYLKKRKIYSYKEASFGPRVDDRSDKMVLLQKVEGHVSIMCRAHEKLCQFLKVLCISIRIIRREESTRECTRERFFCSSLKPQKTNFLLFSTLREMLYSVLCI